MSFTLLPFELLTTMGYTISLMTGLKPVTTEGSAIEARCFWVYSLLLAVFWV